MLRRTSCFAAAVFSAIVLASGAAAADPTPADRAAARTLFDDARKLMTQGSFAAACPKLEESQRIDPGMGTQFNLAECQEKIGKLASAWENFLEVANNAKNAGQSAREVRRPRARRRDRAEDRQARPFGRPEGRRHPGQARRRRGPEAALGHARPRRPG